ncbi:MAG TPA: 23S rRNA (pseudouridine(1915)-N(3))-methyltransferase RlmH [Gemmatimonadaceae bacterium]
MKFIVAAVGKPRDAALAAAIRDYEARAGKYWPLEVHEVREEPGGAPPATVMAKEAERLSAKTKGAIVVACDAGGSAMTSERFAKFMQDARERASDLAFVIGGANGLGETVKAQAQQRLSLAPWTLPHELARLVLAEQLYRAGTIVKREPYHK